MVGESLLRVELSVGWVSGRTVALGLLRWFFLEVSPAWDSAGLELLCPQVQPLLYPPSCGFLILLGWVSFCVPHLLVSWAPAVHSLVSCFLPSLVRHMFAEWGFFGEAGPAPALIGPLSFESGTHTPASRLRFLAFWFYS